MRCRSAIVGVMKAHRMNVKRPCREDSHRSHSPCCKNGAPHDGFAGGEVREDLVAIESDACLLCTGHAVCMSQSSRMNTFLVTLIWALQMSPNS